MNVVNDLPLTPLSFLERSAKVFPDRTAVIDGDTSLTYQAFHQHTQALSGGLEDLGVGRDDRVAVLALNGIPLLAAHYAIPRIGAVLVALNTRLARLEIAHILRHAGASVLIAAPELVSGALRLKAECPDLRAVVTLGEVTGGDTADLTYAELIEQGARRPAPLQVTNERSLITINYTSGTTGLPKGVMYTHRGAYLNALGNAVEHGLTSETRYLWTLPMFHCNGWCYPWSVTAVGGLHVCMPKVIPSEVFRLVQQERITHLCAAPTVLIDLAQYAASAQLKLEDTLHIATGGAAPAPQVIKNMEAIGANVVHLYGLTETYGPSTFCQWHPHWDELSFEERAQLKARQGVADLMVEQRVVRPDMTDVAADGVELGELVIRGHAVMEGYYQDPEATQEAFHGGWFHTGDLAVVYPNGYVEIKDRQKDVIISGGENISTLEVERILYSHPAVLEAAVVSSPHDRWGEVPKAFVVLRPGVEVLPEDLHSHCRQYLAGFKVPKLIAFVMSLPKTSTGKIQKSVLRQQEWIRSQEGTE